eukprot:Tamp_15476.p1 GENE.Tamp_15476~~Tamp_15476.p1  ORF type:complete len:274 (-),score=13.54 Tamp_15476:272-1093(-)
MGLSSASCLCWLKKPSPHKAQARRKTVGSLSDKRGSSSSNAWAGLPLAEMPAFGLGRRGSGGFKRGLVPDDAVYFYRFIIDDIMHRKLSGKECKKKRKRGCTNIYSRVLHATPYEIALRSIDLSDLASRKPHRDHTKKIRSNRRKAPQNRLPRYRRHNAPNCCPACDALLFDGLIKFSTDPFYVLPFPVWPFSPSGDFPITACSCFRCCGRRDYLHLLSAKSLEFVRESLNLLQKFLVLWELCQIAIDWRSGLHFGLRCLVLSFARWRFCAFD